jgi:AsmA protein
LGGRTPFDRLTAKLRIHKGKARIEQAQLESALVRVSVAGEASIAQRDLDLKGTAGLVRPAAAANAATQPFELPFLVQGSWERPFLLPDPASLIQRSGAAAPLLDAARRQATARAKATPASDTSDDAQRLSGAQTAESERLPTADADSARERPRP